MFLKKIQNGTVNTMANGTLLIGQIVFGKIKIGAFLAYTASAVQCGPEKPNYKH